MHEDYRKVGLEDIVEGEMGVKESNRSEHFLKMKKIADEYYKLIIEGKEEKNPDEVNAIKEKLEKLMLPFYDDPAYVTYLESFQHILTNK